MLRLRTFTCLVSAGAALLALPSESRAASWLTNVNYGGGSTVTDIYVPSNVKTSPPVLFSLHYCSGQGGNAHSWFQSYADQYGFLIITPSSHGNCFDANLHRSGEQADMVAMIDYVITKYNADTTRVYAAGLSSGACMTQALIADYPDRFTAGASFAGVPAGAWTGGNDYAWSAPASTTAAQWGDKVRAADPGFTGPRPRIQFWQGQGDTTLTYSQTYPAELAQWPNVFGLGDADATKTSIKPSGAKNTWARTSYKDCNGDVVVEANSGPSNVTHDLGSENIWGDGIRFFGLDSGGITLKPCSGTTGGSGGMGGSAGMASAGAPGSGGAATGGSPGAGGMPGGAGTGGTGPAGTGGTVGSAGTTSAGGTTGTGGSAGTATGTGGTGTAAGTGGTAMGTGGAATGTGGTVTGAGGTTTGTGGKAAGTGGATTGTGGKAAGTGGTAGGAPVVTDGGTTTPDDPNGCGCHVAGQSRGGESALLLAGGLALFGARRRRRARG